jgi:hypothetical protein
MTRTDSIDKDALDGTTKYMMSQAGMNILVVPSSSLTPEMI